MLTISVFNRYEGVYKKVIIITIHSWKLYVVDMLLPSANLLF